MRIPLRRTILFAGIAVVAAGAGVNYAYQARSNDEVADELRLVLNVPANRLYVYENGARTRTYAVSIGLRGYETPAGQYRIREVIWNPWWHPPNSGWARGRTTEPPGPSNPMGRAKLNFGPMLYIHGTSAYQGIGNPASRGCVRMRNSEVMELALLVHRYASPNVDPGLLSKLQADPGMTRRIGLQRPISFTAVYDVAVVDDGFLILYPDVYKRVKTSVRDQVANALKEVGIAMSDVNRSHLDRLLEKSKTRRVAISLAELTSRTTATAEDADHTTRSKQAAIDRTRGDRSSVREPLPPRSEAIYEPTQSSSNRSSSTHRQAGNRTGY